MTVSFLNDAFQVMDEWPNEGRVELGFEAPALLPGMTLAGRRISYVEHRFYPDTMRTVAWIE